MAFKKLSNNTCIVLHENETYFINNIENGLHLKQEFMTTEGYEVGIDVYFDDAEFFKLVEFLNEVVKLKSSEIEDS